MSASADIIRRWMTCMEVLNSILLDLPLRIELPVPSGPDQFAELIDTLKRTLTLLGEEPMLSAVEEETGSYLSQAIGELL